MPRRIWAGKKAADEYADAGAKTHAISDTQMNCYEWIRATAHLVRERIAATTKDALARRPPDDKELREARRLRVRMRRKEVRRKKDLLGIDATRRPPTQHILERDRRGTGWQCQCCWDAVSPSTTAQTVAKWLAQPCSGPPPLTAATVTKFGVESHPSHKLRRLLEHRRWFCELCGAATTELVATKLQEPCCGRPSCESGRYRLQDWLKQAAKEGCRGREQERGSGSAGAGGASGVSGRNEPGEPPRRAWTSLAETTGGKSRGARKEESAEPEDPGAISSSHSDCC